MNENAKQIEFLRQVASDFWSENENENAYAAEFAYVSGSENLLAKGIVIGPLGGNDALHDDDDA